MKYNHIHALLFCPDVSRISKMMAQCNTSYGLYYNKKREKIGHVFRERFRSEGIYTKFMDDEYSKENVKEVIEEILSKRRFNKKYEEDVIEVYCELKERCRISDTEIASLFGMNRFSLIRKLKKAGIK